MPCRNTSESGTVARLSPCASPAPWLPWRFVSAGFEHSCSPWPSRCRAIRSGLPKTQIQVARQDASCRRTAGRLTCCLLESKTPARRRKSPPPGIIAFPAGEIHRNFYRQFARRDHVEASPLSRGVTFKPLSGPLQPGVRFLHHPLPALPSASLAIGLPARKLPSQAEIRAYPVPYQQHEQVRSCLSTGGACVDVSLYQKEASGHLPFGRGGSAASARL